MGVDAGVYQALTKEDQEGTEPACVSDGITNPHEEHCPENVQEAWHVHPVDVLQVQSDRGGGRRVEERESKRARESERARKRERARARVCARVCISLSLSLSVVAVYGYHAFKHGIVVSHSGES